MIVAGGVIPPQDYDAVKAAGAAAIFPPGTVIAEAAAGLLSRLITALGHASWAACHTSRPRAGPAARCSGPSPGPTSCRLDVVPDGDTYPPLPSPTTPRAQSDRPKPHTP